MVNRLKKYGVDLAAGSIFNADKGYDGERNFESLFGIYFQISNKEQTPRKVKTRKKAAKIFNASIYHYRGLIEGIFGVFEKLSIISFITDSDKRIIRKDFD